MLETQETKKINLHFRRFEFKYHLPRATADAVVPQLLKYMDWDPYAQDEKGYDVYSLYFDSPDHEAYHEKIDGYLNRKKLRIRSYIGNPTAKDNVFFELKRKSGDVILKDREVLQAESIAKMIENPFSLFQGEYCESPFLNEVIYECANRQMTPSVLIHYKRRPFFAKFDKKFRVTFDYDVAAAKPEGDKLDMPCDPINPEIVIMEVKFTGSMPQWFSDIIETHSLAKDTFSKYCYGIEHQYGIPDFS